MNTIKFYLRISWIALVIVGLVLFFLYPHWFTKEGLSRFIHENATHILWTYIGICLLRGLFLLPSTPFVFAGILLFPDSPWLVFWVSLIGIMITAIYLYVASHFLEFDKLFGKVNSKKILNLKEKLNKYGFWIVLGWSFFPFVPTDLICYIAGSLKMNLSKYLAAVFIGEAILVGIYVFFVGQLAT